MESGLESQGNHSSEWKPFFHGAFPLKCYNAATKDWGRGGVLMKHMNEKKQETVRARIRPSLKRETQEILNEMGLTTSQAIILFLEQVRLQKRLPFPIEVPTPESRASMDETFESPD
jgi:DNA-damage-inducible protein J